MTQLKKIITGIAVAGTLASATQAVAATRDTINIVGSSTVYPFATVVAERFGSTGKFPTPKLESTGSGGGMKLFCAGVGTEHPDITNASRRMKSSEFTMCNDNGVKDITEFRIGSDGIVIASSNEIDNIDLTLEEIFLALAAKVPGKDGQLIDNPNKNWSDVDSSLPNKPIRVMGPPPTSGTRDAFVEIAMEGGCKKFDITKEMSKNEKKEFCESIREDGAFIEAGENDNLIVQKLTSDTSSYGIFGYSFLEENAGKIQAAHIDGVEPTYDNIASDKYPLSRSLWFYVKKQHMGVIPGMQEYLNEFFSPRAMGKNGYLKDVGLIVPTKDQWKELQKTAKQLPSMTGNEL